MDINEFTDFSELLQTFSQARQKQALKEIASYLLRSNKKRLKQNIEPSGQSMTARKNGNQKMFQKLGRSLQLKNSGSDTAIGYYGNVGRIANNHQLGKLLKRTVAGRTMLIDLPVRLLLGLDEEDRLAVNEIFLKHMSPQ